MSTSLATTITIYAALQCGWATVDALRGRGRHQLHSAGLVVLEAALVVQALLGAVALLAGGHAAEPAVHAGYLVASPLVLPLVLPAAAGQRGPWQAVITALACLAVLVVVLRLQATWETRP
jgi:hypothetical protein